MEKVSVGEGAVGWKTSLAPPPELTVTSLAVMKQEELQQLSMRSVLCPGKPPGAGEWTGKLDS